MVWTRTRFRGQQRPGDTTWWSGLSCHGVQRPGIGGQTVRSSCASRIRVPSHALPPWSARARTRVRRHAHRGARLGHTGPCHRRSPPQILSDEGEAIPRPHRAVQRMGEVEDRVIDQHFNMLGQISRRRVPEGFV